MRFGPTRLCVCLAMSFIASLLTGSFAQVPNVQMEFLDPARRIRGDQLTFCVGEDSFLLHFERALAQELAEILLLEANVYEYPSFYPPRPYDYTMSITYENIFVLFTNHCDVLLGMTLGSDPRPDWLAMSRPIYETDFVLATIGPFRRLADIPREAAIGTRLMSQGDLRLGSYLHTLSDEERWKRFPYNDNSLLFDRLMDGAMAAALIWEPALQELTKLQSGSDRVKVIPTAPFRTPTLQFGVAVMAENSFLRSMLDKAIEALISDGTIAQLLEETGVPARDAH